MVAQGLARSFGMIAGRVGVEMGGLIVEFSEADLRLSEVRRFYGYIQVKEERYFGIDIASGIIKDGFKVLMSKTIDHKVG